MRDAGIKKRAREDCVVSVWSLIVMITDGGICNESSDNCAVKGSSFPPVAPNLSSAPFSISSNNPDRYDDDAGFFIWERGKYSWDGIGDDRGTLVAEPSHRRCINYPPWLPPSNN